MEKNEFKLKHFAQATHRALIKSIKSLSVIVFAGALLSTPAIAQQTGKIEGKVISDSTKTGMTITVTSDAMPKARTVNVKEDGSYNLPLLTPGTYELVFRSGGGTEKKMVVEVLLDQTSIVDFNVTADSSDSNRLVITGNRIIREGDSSLGTALGEDVIKGVPVGQNYRDLLKLIPGVAYSEMGVLGPNAGGSGRDNKYGFDGVDVSLPMFGTLSAEPSIHDVANVAIEKGGAKAIGFNRSGGFAINTISKSGTNEFKGSVQYTLQDKDFNSSRETGDGEIESDRDESWIIANIGGPIIEDTLFFYTSYYRPELFEERGENARGPVKDYERVREEFYGKITYQPIDDLLLNVSLRTSDNEAVGEEVGYFDADSTSSSSNAYQDIFTLDGSYIISDYTSVSFQYSTFDYETNGAPDVLLPGVTPSLGDNLDLNSLDLLGAFNVPESQPGNLGRDNAVALALIEQYGFLTSNGSREGGGQIGAAPQINDQNFYRDSFEIKLDHEMDIGETTHRIHLGFKWMEGTEILTRSSNGLGSIHYIGGEEDASDGTPIYYRTLTQQMSLQDAGGAVIPGITSGSESYNFEINDTIEHGDFTYNVGLLISQDTLYGQGLRRNSSNVSGFELAPGEKYEMYSIDWQDMIQPRLGVTWNYDKQDTLFANFASYNPEASSLARAASWARNTRATLDVDFDIDGNYIESEPRAGSSGKFFQEGIKPRRIDELTLGTTKALSDEFSIRTHIRRREGSHFWEDTWNGSRNYGTYGPFGGVPEHLRDAGLYIPELQSYRDEVGGSSYVIAELDDAYTSYNEFSIEATYESDRFYFNASYVWSHYYGNFDQDSVSGSLDGNLFIGSSSLADGRGRQLWDGKEGKLFGDKPHVLKLFGTYTTDWDANIGFYYVYQSGNVWEAWDGTPYGSSFSSIKNIEPAGSRRTPTHSQIDLNYTQDFELSEGYVLQLRADIFNLTDQQDAYLEDPFVDNSTFGMPRARFAPRRFQLSLGLSF